MLKKIFLLLIICLFHLNCGRFPSKDDEALHQLVIGKWKTIKYNQLDDQGNEYEFLPDSFCQFLFIELTEDDFIVHNFQNGPESYSNGHYSIKDSMLTNDNNEEYRIRKVNLNELVLTYPIPKTGYGTINTSEQIIYYKRVLQIP